MRKEITIVAEPRDGRGRNEARRLRATGRIPGIVYGAGKEPVAVALEPKQINEILYGDTGHNTIFNVDIKGQELSPAMIVDWQHDPARDTLLHVDLERIDLTKELTVKVPIQTEGEAKGVKQQGGLLELVTREIEVRCLPGSIPDRFVVDVRNLMLGDNVRARDLEMGPQVTLVSAPETVICHVVALRVTEAAAAEAEPEAGAEEKKEEKK